VRRPSSRRRLVLGLGLGLVVAALAATPLVGAWAVRRLVLPRMAAKLGVPVEAAEVRVRLGSAELIGLRLGGEPTPLLLPRVRVLFSVLPLFAGKVRIGVVDIEQARVDGVRRLDGLDNLSVFLERLGLRGGSGAGSNGSAARSGGGLAVTVEKVRLRGGALLIADGKWGEVLAHDVEADVHPTGPAELRLGEVKMRLAAGPWAAADKVIVRAQLARGKPTGLPSLEVEGGVLHAARGLDLTGIAGTIEPDGDAPDRARIALRGSYGGAGAELWNATGWVDPKKATGDLQVRAARFRLEQLGDFLSGQVLENTKNAEVDGHLALHFFDGVLTYKGRFHLAGLTVAHPMLAPVAVPNLGFDATLRGSLDVRNKYLILEEATVDFRDVHALFTADVQNLNDKPRFAATMRVKPVSCQAVLSSLPRELVPALQGFKLQGTLSTDLHLGIDMADLESPVDLGGKVGIEGCKVVEAPHHADARRLTGTFEQTVPDETGKWETFLVGPEWPDFVPYAEISPHLINSIMTTEDSGFFKHRGFITSEFRSALQRNLQAGRFRLGASSITMQMVKNVLLSREKTLSRKLQEMFLTWYLERHLTKERILEMYFNVIEFGPGIYGIGKAARHYFGKHPRDLEPQEAAFFSSILPSPKRRYVHYCNASGELSAKWDAYVKRIMRKSHERKRLTDEEFAKAMATPVRFDRKEARPERECLALVKRLTTPLQPAK
jgi:hypothetical protein